MGKIKLILYILCDKNIILKAIKIAVIVGIILNLINQGDTLLKLDFQNTNFFKMGLTFLVPFCVSTYTAVSMKIKYHVGEKAVMAATLMCKECKQIHKVKQNEIIPFCVNCKEKTNWKIKKIRDDNVNCGN